MKRVALMLAILGILCVFATGAQAHGYGRVYHQQYGYWAPGAFYPPVVAPPRLVVPPPAFCPPVYRYPVYRYRYYEPSPHYGFYYRGRGLSFGFGF